MILVQHNYFPAAHVKGWDHDNYLDENFVIEGNIFDRARNMILHCCAAKEQYLPCFKDNIYIQYNNVYPSTFARWGVCGSAAANISYDVNVKNIMEEKKLDPNGGVYFTERDWLFDLPDYLPKSERN